MTYRSPYEKTLRVRRILVRLVGFAAILIVCLLLDRPAYRLLAVTHVPVTELEQDTGTSSAKDLELLTAARAARKKMDLQSKDWYQMFRAAGYLPTWLFIGAGLWLAGKGSQESVRLGQGVILGSIASGLAAEILKPILGRHRPALDGSMDWNPLLGGLFNPDSYGHSLGLPSSHAAVAFGAAFVLYRLNPGAGCVAIIAATGCALTRLYAGAHVLSDVVVACMLAWLISALIVRLIGTREGPNQLLMRFD